MDEIRNVAEAYFDAAEDAEKECVRKRFRKLDEDGDEKITLSEYKEQVNPFFSSERLFKELDKNDDGALDFNEFLALYYIDKVSIPKCNGCDDFLTASYFSCLSCQTTDAYYLCCTCYRRTPFTHQHSPCEFLDNRAMLKLLLKKADITADPPNDDDGYQRKANTKSPAGLNQSTPTLSEKMKKPFKVIGGGIRAGRAITNFGGDKAAKAWDDICNLM